MSTDGLGFGAGGIAEGLQLAQNLQTGKIEQAQKQVALESSQIQLQNMKDLQASLQGQLLAKHGIAASDPTERTNALLNVADEYFAANMPQQAGQVADTALKIAESNAYAANQQAQTAQRELDVFGSLFSGATNEAEWEQAKLVAPQFLSKQTLANPAVQKFLQGSYSPEKTKILPGYLDYLKGKTQAHAADAQALAERARAEVEGKQTQVQQSEIDANEARANFYNHEVGGGKDASADMDELLSNAANKYNVSFATGSRSQIARQQILEGIQKAEPRLEDETDAAYADRVMLARKGQQLAMVGKEAEVKKVSQRQANIESAQEALTEQGGLYDQLTEAGSKVDFEDLKTANQVRLGIQRKVYANPQIQAYVTTLQEARAELGQVLSRSGQLTDKAREQAEEALPDTMSFPELKAAIEASKKATVAVMSGNERVIQALKEGKSVYEATGIPNPTRTFATEVQVRQAFKAGRLKKGDTVTVGGKEFTIK